MIIRMILIKTKVEINQLIHMNGNKALEVLIGMLGWIVGGMLGLWILIELVNTNKIQ